MADELKDIYHRFNPDKALLNDELGKYYVEIDQNETVTLHVGTIKITADEHRYAA